MSHVTFETAQRLEAAGFNRPEIAFGQWWYNEGTFGVITHLNIPYAFTFNFAQTGIDRVIMKDFNERFVFAPTATDILKEMPLERLEFGIDYKSGTGESWSVGLFSHSTNPAEAAAMAWLQVHEKR